MDTLIRIKGNDTNYYFSADKIAEALAQLPTKELDALTSMIRMKRAESISKAAIHHGESDELTKPLPDTLDNFEHDGVVVMKLEMSLNKVEMRFTQEGAFVKVEAWTPLVVKDDECILKLRESFNQRSIIQSKLDSIGRETITFEFPKPESL